MTVFRTHDFGSLSLCSVAVLSASCSSPSPNSISGTFSLEVKSLAHMHELASDTQLLSFGLTSFPKAKSAKFCILWSRCLTIFKYHSQLQGCMHSSICPSAPEGCQGEAAVTGDLFWAWSNWKLSNNHFTVWNLSLWINTILLLLSLDVELYWRKLLFFHTEFCFRVVCVKNNTNRSTFGWSYWTVSKKSPVWWREICL